MLNSHPAHVIRHLTGSFAELSRVGRMAARDEMRHLSAEIGAAVHSTRAAGKEAGELAAQLHGLRALAPALEGSVKELEAALRSMAEAELRMLESTLQRAIGRFADAECARLGEAMHHGDRGRVWSCDTAPLRRVLAEASGNGSVTRRRSSWPRKQKSCPDCSMRWRGSAGPSEGADPGPAADTHAVAKHQRARAGGGARLGCTLVEGVVDREAGRS